MKTHHIDYVMLNCNFCDKKDIKIPKNSILKKKSNNDLKYS